MNRLNVTRLAEVLSEILTDKHGAKVVVTFNPREEEQKCEESPTIL
jgi:hypothetical protein